MSPALRLTLLFAFLLTACASPALQDAASTSTPTATPRPAATLAATEAPPATATATVAPTETETPTPEPAVSSLSPLDTAWVEQNWTMTDLSKNPAGFDFLATKLSQGGLKIKAEFQGAADFQITDESGVLVLRVDYSGNVFLLDKAGDSQGAAPMGKVSGKYKISWEILPDGSMRIKFADKAFLMKVSPNSINLEDGAKVKLIPQGGLQVYGLAAGTIGSEVAVVAPPAPAVDPAPPVATPLPTPEAQEGGLPPGAVRFNEGGINGIRSPVPIPSLVPRFAGGYAVDDCRPGQSCSEIAAFDSLKEAQDYWTTQFPGAVLEYEIWFFDDGGVSNVFVSLIGN